LSVSSLLTCKKISCSRSECKELGKVQLSHLNGGGHQAPAGACGTPSVGVGVLGYESMGMEAMQDAADFGAFAFGITALLCKMRRGLEAGT